MASLAPQDKCPPATAVVFAVTLRRRLSGESRSGGAVTGIKTKATTYAPNGRSTRLAPVVTSALAGELARWADLIRHSTDAEKLRQLRTRRSS